MFLESKYIVLLSNRLRNFKRKGDTYVFSCPYCNDSKKSKYKARGSVYPYKGIMLYNCYNCSDHPSTAANFLKDQDKNLFNEFLKEKLQNRKSLEPAKEVLKQEPVDFHIFNTLRKVSDLDPFHPVAKYCRNRKIPEARLSNLYYTTKFKAFINSVVPDKFETPIKHEEPRLVIPFVDKESVIGFQCRSFDPKALLKYVAITLDYSKPKIFGGDRVDYSKRFFVVEGPIDSLFIPNCIAVGSSNLTSVPKTNAILVFDNEPRNPEICRKIEKSIDQGWSVVIWPNSIKENDINDMILANIDVVDIISKNIYIGLEAKINFGRWKK